MASSSCVCLLSVPSATFAMVMEDNGRQQEQEGGKGHIRVVAVTPRQDEEEQGEGGHQDGHGQGQEIQKLSVLLEDALQLEDPGCSEDAADVDRTTTTSETEATTSAESLSTSVSTSTGGPSTSSSGSSSKSTRPWTPRHRRKSFRRKSSPPGRPPHPPRYPPPPEKPPKGWLLLHRPLVGKPPPPKKPSMKVLKVLSMSPVKGSADGINANEAAAAAAPEEGDKDSETAESEGPKLAFDSHCHLDRLFNAASRGNRTQVAAEVTQKKGYVYVPDRRWEDGDWGERFEAFVQEHSDELAQFEGCITVFCDPRDFYKFVSSFHSTKKRARPTFVLPLP